MLPGTLAFIAVMLGSVGFDSVSRTSFWLDLQVRLGGELERMLVSFAGLVGTVLAVALAYLAAVAAAKALTRYEGDLAGPFLGSLVPIALVYVVAHYFSLLLLQGQYLVPLDRPVRQGLGPDRHGDLQAEPGAADAERRLVHAGVRARRRARGRPRARARPSGRHLPNPRWRCAASTRCSS